MARHPQPVWKAAIAAPLAAPLAMAAAMAWESVSVSGLAGLREAPVAALLLFAFGLPIAYAAMLAFGLPYVLWLRSRDRLTWIPVYAGAAVLGAVVWAGFWQMSFRPPTLPRTLGGGAIIGLLVGVVFCWVAGCGPGNPFKQRPLRSST